MLEKLVFKKWLTLIVPKISPSQFAFVPRSGRGTTSALTVILHHILSFLDTPGTVRMLMIDYQKAFDKIPHEIVLRSLISFNPPRVNEMDGFLP